LAVDLLSGRDFPRLYFLFIDDGSVVAADR
jgi:hypothetical protein